jgi:MFS family permease
MSQGGRSHPLAPLRERRFLVFWAGQTISFAGNSVFPVALTLHLAGDVGSATSLGLVLAAMALSESMFYLVGGVWADRLPRHLLMAGCDTVRAVVQTVAGLALVQGLAGTGELAFAGALLGACGGVFAPASSGVVVALATKERLLEANALMTVSRRTALLLGPLLATTLTLTVGAGWALVLDGATFAVSAAALMFLKLPRRPRTVSGRFLGEVGEGWRAVRARPWLEANLAVHGLWNLARTAYFTVGPVIVIAHLGGTAAWGTIVQCSTIGALCGALLALRLRPRHPLVAGNIGLALGGAPLILIAVGAPTPAIAVGAAVMSAGLGLLGPLWDTVVQQRIPENLLSRVASFDWLVSSALIPVGMALAGPLVNLFGNVPVMSAAAALMTVPALAVLGRPALRNTDADAHEQEPTGPAVRQADARN